MKTNPDRPRRRRRTPSHIGVRVPRTLVRAHPDQITDVLTLDGLDQTLSAALGLHRVLQPKLTLALQADDAILAEYAELGRAIQAAYDVLHEGVENEPEHA